jgi:hypothetical protein
MWRYYWAIIRRIPALLWVAANWWKSVVVIIAFLLTLFNGPLGRRVTTSWQAISPWWALLPVGILLAYELMKSNYEQYCERERSLKEELAKVQHKCSSLKPVVTDPGKPQRTPLEEKNHQALKSRLEKYGEEEKTVLRHLSVHGKMVHRSGWDISPPVQGLTHDRTLAMLNKLLADQMVTPESQDIPGGWVRVWRISPGAISTLNELL